MCRERIIGVDRMKRSLVRGKINFLEQFWLERKVKWYQNSGTDPDEMRTADTADFHIYCRDTRVEGCEPFEDTWSIQGRPPHLSRANAGCLFISLETSDL